MVDEGVVTSAPPQQRRQVAPRNEALLREQNAALWNEYIKGAWAHPSPVEAGGLLCRLPLASQIVDALRSSARGEGGAGRLRHWGEQLKKRLLAELPEPTEGRSREEVFQTWVQNTNYCFRLAENLVHDSLSDIASRMSDIPPDMSKLGGEEIELISAYSELQQNWQSVCLVLGAREGEAEKAVVINRPVAMRLDRRLAGMLLNGEVGQKYGDDDIERCYQAFGQQAAVYLGGPRDREEPARLVHGFEGLPGASELAPGTKVFVGGVDAAIEGVIEGTYKPLDFRWFIGCHTGLRTDSGEWLAVACARPIALKQCLGLPKPLWHEVMELCGGECATVSRLEIVQRTDLQEDDSTSTDDLDNE